MILIAIFSLVLVVGMPYLMENCTIAVFHLPVADNRSGPRGEGGTRRDAEEPEGDGKLCYEPAEYGYWFEFCVLDGRIIKLRRPKDEVRVQFRHCCTEAELEPGWFLTAASAPCLPS
jgi:hypothetical protein